MRNPHKTFRKSSRKKKFKPIGSVWLNTSSGVFFLKVSDEKWEKVHNEKPA